MLKTFTLIFILLSLSACRSSHTRDWYIQNMSAPEKRVAECNNDAAIEGKADCQNAIAAAAQVLVFGK